MQTSVGGGGVRGWKDILALPWSDGWVKLKALPVVEKDSTLEHVLAEINALSVNHPEEASRLFALTEVMVEDYGSKFSNWSDEYAMDVLQFAAQFVGIDTPIKIRVPSAMVSMQTDALATAAFGVSDEHLILPAMLADIVTEAEYRSYDALFDPTDEEYVGRVDARTRQIGRALQIAVGIRTGGQHWHDFGAGRDREEIVADIKASVQSEPNVGVTADDRNHNHKLIGSNDNTRASMEVTGEDLHSEVDGITSVTTKDKVWQLARISGLGIMSFLVITQLACGGEGVEPGVDDGVGAATPTGEILDAIEPNPNGGVVSEVVVVESMGEDDAISEQSEVTEPEATATPSFIIDETAIGGGGDVVPLSLVELQRTVSDQEVALGTNIRLDVVGEYTFAEILEGSVTYDGEVYPKGLFVMLSPFASQEGELLFFNKFRAIGELEGVGIEVDADSVTLTLDAETGEPMLVDKDGKCIARLIQASNNPDVTRFVPEQIYTLGDDVRINETGQLVVTTIDGQVVATRFVSEDRGVVVWQVKKEIEGITYDLQELDSAVQERLNTELGAFGFDIVEVQALGPLNSQNKIAIGDSEYILVQARMPQDLEIPLLLLVSTDSAGDVLVLQEGVVSDREHLVDRKFTLHRLATDNGRTEMSQLKDTDIVFEKVTGVGKDAEVVVTVNGVSMVVNSERDKKAFEYILDRYEFTPMLKLGVLSFTPRDEVITDLSSDNPLVQPESIIIPGDISKFSYYSSVESPNRPVRSWQEIVRDMGVGGDENMVAAYEAVFGSGIIGVVPKYNYSQGEANGFSTETFIGVNGSVGLREFGLVVGTLHGISEDGKSIMLNVSGANVDLEGVPGDRDNFVTVFSSGTYENNVYILEVSDVQNGIVRAGQPVGRMSDGSAIPELLDLERGVPVYVIVGIENRVLSMRESFFVKVD